MKVRYERVIENKERRDRVRECEKEWSEKGRERKEFRQNGI
jgi:hypothetical protein